jgi:hypothetical protein
VKILAERFHRYESTDGEITLTDADSEVITFSGKPDLIVLAARTNGALVTLGDVDHAEESAITVLAGQHLELRLARRRVLGRNLVAGQGASLSVAGFYGEKENAAPSRSNG